MYDRIKPLLLSTLCQSKDPGEESYVTLTIACHDSRFFMLDLSFSFDVSRGVCDEGDIA